MHVKQMKVQREKMERCNGTMMTKKEQRKKIVTNRDSEGKGKGMR